MSVMTEADDKIRAAIELIDGAIKALLPVVTYDALGSRDFSDAYTAGINQAFTDLIQVSRRLK